MVRKEMSEIDEYLKDEYKRKTSFTLTPIYRQCLRKLSVKFYGDNYGFIITTLRRIIVEEGLNILKGEPIDQKLWEEAEKVENTDVVMVKINDKIEELLQKVVTIHFMSRSHFVRYAILKTFREYFPEKNVWKAKVVSLGRLF